MNKFEQKLDRLTDIIRTGKEMEQLSALRTLEFMNSNIRDFVVETDKIEGYIDTPKEHQVEHKTRLKTLLFKDKLSVDSLVEYNTAGRLRLQSGMNVFIGDHEPKPGGQHILYELDNIVQSANIGTYTPYALHAMFETLHPFTDGNGRTGRAIWLWQMVNQEDYNIGLGFLHKWYYQSLEAWRIR